MGINLDYINKFNNGSIWIDYTNRGNIYPLPKLDYKYTLILLVTNYFNNNN